MSEHPGSRQMRHQLWHQLSERLNKYVMWIQLDTNWGQKSKMLEAPITPRTHFWWTALIWPEVVLSLARSCCRPPLLLSFYPRFSLTLAFWPPFPPDLCLTCVCSSCLPQWASTWQTAAATWQAETGGLGRPLKRLQIFTITWGALCVELVSLKCLVFTLNFNKARSTARVIPYSLGMFHFLYVLLYTSPKQHETGY